MPCAMSAQVCSGLNGLKTYHTNHRYKSDIQSLILVKEHVAWHYQLGKPPSVCLIYLFLDLCRLPIFIIINRCKLGSCPYIYLAAGNLTVRYNYLHNLICIRPRTTYDGLSPFKNDYVIVNPNVHIFHQYATKHSFQSSNAGHYRNTFANCRSYVVPFCTLTEYEWNLITVVDKHGYDFLS